MNEALAWIDNRLRDHGLTPPNWTMLLSASQSNVSTLSTVGNWWFFDEESSVRAAYKQLNERYPERHVVAFARDMGSDDIACFVLSDQESNAPIVVNHHYAPPQAAVRGRCNSFEDWVLAVSSQDSESEEAV